MKLNAALGARGLVEHAGGDEFVPRHEVGRQADLDHSRRADAQTGGVNVGPVRVSAELSGIEANPLPPSLSPTGGEGARRAGEGVAFRSKYTTQQRPAKGRELAI